MQPGYGFEEYFIRGLESKDFPRAVVESVHDDLDLIVGDRAEVVGLGKVLQSGDTIGQSGNRNRVTHMNGTNLSLIFLIFRPLVFSFVPRSQDA